MWSAISDYILVLAKGQARNNHIRCQTICCVSASAYIEKDSCIALLASITVELPDMKDKNLLLATLGLLQTAIKHSKELALNAVKAVYFLLDNSHNWVRVLILKLLSKLITIEPRLAKKAESKVHTLLVATHVISVECELLQLCVEHYMSIESLFDLIIGKTESFLDAPDSNLNIIGFKVLKVILERKPDLLPQFSERLSTKVKEQNTLLATHIFEIYEVHINEVDAESFIHKLSKLLAQSSTPSYKEVVAGTICRMLLKSPPIVKDWNSIIEECLPSILPSIREDENCTRFKQIISQLNDKNCPVNSMNLYLTIISSFLEQNNLESSKSASHKHFWIVYTAFLNLSSLDVSIIEENVLKESEEKKSTFMLILKEMAKMRGHLSLEQQVDYMMGYRHLFYIVPEEEKEAELVKKSTDKDIAVACRYSVDEMVWALTLSNEEAKKIENSDLKDLGIDINAPLKTLTKLEVPEAELKLIAASKEAKKQENKTGIRFDV